MPLDTGDTEAGGAEINGDGADRGNENWEHEGIDKEVNGGQPETEVSGLPLLWGLKDSIGTKGSPQAVH